MSIGLPAHHLGNEALVVVKADSILGSVCVSECDPTEIDPCDLAAFYREHAKKLVEHGEPFSYHAYPKDVLPLILIQGISEDARNILVDNLPKIFCATNITETTLLQFLNPEYN